MAACSSGILKSSDREDSEGEINLMDKMESSSKGDFVGNVSHYIPLPDCYKGPINKGHLLFDACFEGGNLGRVDYVSHFEYDLFVRPDTCNPRFRVWFNFTVSNTKNQQRIIFHVVNFSKTKSLYREGMSPLVLSTSRPEWCRIPPKNVFYYRSPDHQRNYVMSFAFAFDNEEDTYQFAYCYPYTYTKLQQYLQKLDSLGKDYYKREILGYSVQQRNLDLITISSPENLKLGSKAKVILITGRIHPGESPSSYVCEGIMGFLMSDTREARLLRKHLVFKIIPMLNPDGVFLGNYRCSLMGFDLNRHWHDPSPWAHPTLHATKQLVMRLDKEKETDLEFYVDIHAHSTLTNGFMYGNVYDEEKRFESHAVYPKLLCQRAHDFSWGKTSFNKDAEKAGTGRRYLGDCLHEHTNCYTLEVSFFCYTDKETGDHIPYTQEGYVELGRNVVKTFIDYYQLL
ncbi:PREDICTED: cytosolic carboxypeptidase 6-like [Amphimedon queenslandica]|uniref:Peptidase M14 domain-containing protein n=1 Tax=Amphimedon queenslandica TaxID=400682 RepID=A0A1X7UC38_AMPQE|nr:PREDICTED: cytosolic carboxypeptidase 6-like [Amphimedon queenslandica]|eukprot:XP_003388443.3 PREDICTED: cytosolic carboxypeptidase 6-like [Amphimedon queenslandica]